MLSGISDALDNLKPHTLLGHSLGGWLVAHYASLCGAGLRPIANRLNYSGPTSLLLANPSGIFPTEEFKQEFMGLYRSCASEGLSRLRPRLFAKEPLWFPCIRSSVAHFLMREDVTQFLNSVREDHLLDDRVGNIHSKVWLLWGEKDTLIPADCSNTWIQKLNAQSKKLRSVILLRNSGHSPHLEQPAMMAAVIAQILLEKTPHRLGEHWWKVINSEILAIS
jgi:pimeloyl-ACP methyl ester carboxylesterase